MHSFNFQCTMSQTARVLQTSILLEIPNMVNFKKISSSDFIVQDVPWNVIVENKNERLAVYLFCAKKNISPEWSHAARATFNLIPFDEKQRPYVCHIDPRIFDSSSLSYGCEHFIRWDYLFDFERKFIENDKINLEIMIEAENKNDQNRSTLAVTHSNSHCAEGCSASFHLTVANVKKLFALKTDTFMMRNLPWFMQIYKRSNRLFGSLECTSVEKIVSCNVKLRVKLVSNNEEQPIEITRSRSYGSSQNTSILIEKWDELFKPANGYVNDNSIKIEIKIDADNPGRPIRIGNDVKRMKLECPICTDLLCEQAISTSECGHLFCTACILAIENCAMCHAPIKNLRRVFLPL